MPIRYVEVDVPAALQWAVEHRLYAYDAYVLAAARAARAPLLSLDQQQRRTATAVGVEALEVTT